MYPVELGGGWRVRLPKGSEEMGSGMFPVKDGDADASMRWWNECSEQEHAHWSMIAGSARPAVAYHAFMLAEAYADAEVTAYEWLNSRDGDEPT